MKLAKYSMGIGDRFAPPGEGAASGADRGQAQGVDVVPVWNKSNREHTYHRLANRPACGPRPTRR